MAKLRMFLGLTSATSAATISHAFQHQAPRASFKRRSPLSYVDGLSKPPSQVSASGGFEEALPSPSIPGSDATMGCGAGQYLSYLDTLSTSAVQQPTKDGTAAAVTSYLDSIDGAAALSPGGPDMATADDPAEIVPPENEMQDDAKSAERGAPTSLEEKGHDNEALLSSLRGKLGTIKSAGPISSLEDAKLAKKAAERRVTMLEEKLRIIQCKKRAVRDAPTSIEEKGHDTEALLSSLRGKLETIKSAGPISSLEEAKLAKKAAKRRVTLLEEKLRIVQFKLRLVESERDDSSKHAKKVVRGRVSSMGDETMGAWM